MNTWFKIAFITALVFGGAASAGAGVSFQIGTDNFFLSVGDYDYLPYAYQDNSRYAPPQINFQSMMSQYGRWVRVAQFGRVWQPYASSGWRPYTYGHWIYTEYGPYWEGYEPWAWVGYHYGSWIFDRRYGWVWIQGYDWHPGRVAWAQGYGTIGWMPMPPNGYDYHRGSLSYVGERNQFSYSDNDFGDDYGYDSYGYGGPYDDPRARDMYYNPSYASINFNLWVFIDGSNFGEDNYADYELGPDYTRYAFDEKTVRISNRPMEQRVLEQITQQQIQRVPVEEREYRTDKRSIKVIVPSGNAPLERIRQQSPEVVRQVIAPAFAQEQKQFKGTKSKIQAPVSKIFRQESAKPRVETRTNQQVINTAREAQKNREIRQNQAMERAKQRTEQLKNKSKLKEPGKESGRVLQNPADNRPVGGRVTVQESTPVPTVQPDRSQAPRPMPRNEANVPPPSSQPASPAPAIESQQPRWGNQGNAPRPVNPAGRPVPEISGNPPGVKTTDADITNQALTRVRENKPPGANAISINTKNGIATVSGKVGSAAEANSIIKLVSGVSGVKGVKNKLSVKKTKSR